MAVRQLSEMAAAGNLHALGGGILGRAWAQRSRYWCLTLNNPNDDECVNWERLGRLGDPRIRYLVWQEEEGEFEGTVHYQGYVQFLAPQQMTAVKRVFSQRVHCEPARGTAEENKAYCQKEESRRDLGESAEWGTMFIPKKDQLVHALTAIREGGAPSAVMEDYPVAWVRNRDGILDYHIRLLGARRWAMEVQIFIGPTGAGKSATADAENPGAYYVPWPTGGRWWWPGYEGQHCVVMDEFRHQIRMDVMLKMLDRYDWTLEAKGRNFQFVSHKIVITSNVDPKDWYLGVTTAVKEPLARRIREFCTIYDFTPGRQFGQFEKVARTEHFSFNERPADHADREMTDVPYFNPIDG